MVQVGGESKFLFGSIFHLYSYRVRRGHVIMAGENPWPPPLDDSPVNLAAPPLTACILLMPCI